MNLSSATGNATIADGHRRRDDHRQRRRRAAKISINDVTVAEGNSGQTASRSRSRSTSPGDPITVDYATANGTAAAPGDYTSATGTVTFAPGDTSKTVTVQVNGDTAVEPNETFNVNLSNATGNATILDGTGVGTITNDDVAAPKISINDVTKAEGNSGQTPSSSRSRSRDPGRAGHGQVRDRRTAPRPPRPVTTRRARGRLPSPPARRPRR